MCVVTSAVATPNASAQSDSRDPKNDSALGSSIVADPYLVFVVEETAHLRCGPSGEYYRTDPLRHGQELEVYVETSDGWLGVRPTEASFCWVPADAIALTESKKGGDHASNRKRGSGGASDAAIGEILEDKTVAWIGTNLGRARRYRWQVQLGKGESVTILGSSERDGPDGPQIWYRIVPPSGEFRWIHRDQVVTTAEELIASVKAESATESIEFLPGGPSHTPARTASTRIADQAAEPPSPLRRVSDDRAWNEGDADVQESIERIEARMVARRQARSEFAETAQRNIDGEPNQTDGNPRSLYELVSDGVSGWMKDRDSKEASLEPITQSNRGTAELVPIGSGLAETSRPIETASANESVIATTNQSAKLPAPIAVSPGESTSDLPMLPSTATSPAIPAPITVSASPQPGLRSPQSQVAFLSVPRMITPASSTIAGPLKMRTVDAEQIEQVRRSVAAAEPESLSMELSKLMSRGASEPEIAVVARAAQDLGNYELADRAREYQSLAKRRDGDTVISNERSTTPIAIAPPFATPLLPTLSTPTPLAPIMTTALKLPDNQFISGIAKTSFDHSQPSAPQTQTGVLVEVYSADPSRPPFAITDQGGRTIAYVTPAPGVEVRNHLGSEVRLTGEAGYLQGLNTPHVLATSVERCGR